MSKIEITPEIEAKVAEYVYENYKTYKNKQLIIEDKGNFYTVKININAGPLVLGKKIF